MTTRGNLSDYRSTSHDTLRSGMPSPRIQHLAGDVAPALSPLDAFAAQGRLLARQLDESRHMDRRMSRLPPSSVARSLSRGRPNFFRNPASESHADGLARRNTTKQNFEVEEPKYRPVSEHPRFSSMSHASGISNLSQSDYEDDETTPRTTMISVKPVNDIHREPPEEEESITPVGMSFIKPPFDDASRLHVPQNRAPPMSPNSRPSSSARVGHESYSDDDNSSSNAGSTFSKPRKLSSGSATSLPYSPMSYNPLQHPRSPSISSETSNSHLVRPSFNFSRPLSRSSTSLSAPGAPESHAPPQATGRQPQNMRRASRPTPILLPLVTDETSTAPADGEPSSAVSSYVYAKYDLPRGRMVSRDSVIFAGLQTPHFEWQEPLFENSPEEGEHPRSARTPPPSSRILDYSPKPHSMHEVPIPNQRINVPEPVPRSSLNTPDRGRELRKTRTVSPSSPLAPATTPLTPALTTPERPSRPSTESTQSTMSTPPSQKANVKPDTKLDNKPDKVKPSDVPDNAPSTEVAKSLLSHDGPITLSADEHVAQGIEMHEKGSLSESTYHLRIAAKQGHPTGMLMYALACRHGWGMRPNQQEGVRWLRKAVDSVGLEVLANPNAPGASKAKELHKAYRAQFALSIYELGVSYLNGWGIDQDKPLALRCFEIASEWGDVDAMAEAGYCYAEGVGTKKDMKKAAHFYREAESHGMSMVGTSWIYKDKYMGDDSKDSKESKESRKTRARGRTVSGDKKPRSKSRTRSMFQRKKSVVDT